MELNLIIFANKELRFNKLTFSILCQLFAAQPCAHDFWLLFAVTFTRRFPCESGVHPNRCGCVYTPAKALARPTTTSSASSRRVRIYSLPYRPCVLVCVCVCLHTSARRCRCVTASCITHTHTRTHADTVVVGRISAAGGSPALRRRFWRKIVHFPFDSHP